MGILNCTPDSYFEGSRSYETQLAIEHALHLFEKGADIVDIGGESTRPGSKEISEKEELSRVIPVIKGIRKITPLPLSIDTYKPAVAKAAIEEGVDMINDITGGENHLMRTLAARTASPLVIMHMKGAPHSNPLPDYPRGIVSEISTFFKKRIDELLIAGVKREQIILDPGIGGGSFGKLPDQNLQIIKHLHVFQELGFPLLMSLSRKSFLQKILKKDASEVLSTTLALNTISALRGAAYIRVHDVAEHRDILTILEYMEAID